MTETPLPGLSLGDDGDAVLLVVEPSDPQSSVGKLEPVYRQVEALGQETAAGGLLSVAVTGIPAMRCDLVRIQRAELPRFILAGAVIGLLVAAVIFRSGSAILVVAPVPLLAAFWSLGMMGLFGRTFDLMAIVITPLAMTIAMTSTIHLLCAIREGIEEGQSPMDASRAGLALEGPACLMASLTTMIAFASLALSDSPMLGRLGLTCAGVTALVFVSTVLWIPVATSTRLGRGIGRGGRKGRAEGRSGQLSSVLVSLIGRRAGLLVVSSCGVLGICLVLLSGIKSDYRFSEFLPADQASTDALHRVDAHFGGSNRLYVMVEWPEGMHEEWPEVIDLLEAVTQLLGREEILGEPLSMVSAVGHVPEREVAGRAPGPGVTLPSEIRERLTNAEVRRTMLVVPVADEGSRVLLPMCERISGAFEQLRREHPGFDVQWTGRTYVHALMSGRMIDDLWRGLLAASAGIFLVVGLALRSGGLAVRSILPNVLPLAGVVALIAGTGGSLHYNGVLALTIGLGIAIDDSLHVLYRFKHELQRNGGHRLAAIEASLQSVGLALITTTVVLVAGIGVLMACSLPMARHFALLIIEVLTLALLSDLVILPALLCWPGKRPGHQNLQAGKPPEAPP
ncbi:MAG: efflux RND transporter permease subunit, partial [Planctomycetota bacterium]